MTQSHTEARFINQMVTKPFLHFCMSKILRGYRNEFVSDFLFIYTNITLLTYFHLKLHFKKAQVIRTKNHLYYLHYVYTVSLSFCLSFPSRHFKCEFYSATCLILHSKFEVKPGSRFKATN